MQQFKVDELKPHPRNEEFFDDMIGENWEAFLKSIKDRGVIEPVVISPDKTIVSGHQRVRACKELGIENVLCSVHTYDNEDQVLQDLIETNIRQRGIGNPNPVKLGRCIKELERIYGIREGSAGKRSLEPNVSAPKESDLADLIGISVDTLQNYKKLTELVPELQDWVDTGILAPTTALSIVKYMSEDEQEEFASSMDATKRITKREVNQYIEKIQELEAREPEVVDNTDYKKISQLEEKLSEIELQKRQLELKVKLNEEDAEKFRKLSEDIQYLTKQKESMARQIKSANELSGLTVTLKNTLQKELAPIKFMRCMEVLDENDVARENLIEIVELVEKWTEEIKQYLRTDDEINVIDV